MLQSKENRIRILPVALAVIFLITSCTDTVTQNKKESEQKLSSEKMSLKQKLKNTSLALKQLVTKPKIAKELRYAIKYYRDNKNTDERVTFRNLFDPNSEYKKKWKKRSKTNTSFAEAFRNLGKQKTKTGTFNAGNLEKFLKNKNVTIYFPYSKNWKGENVVPTLTYDPIDNEHRNEGFKPVASGTKNKSTSDTVTVNDTYAQNNPTYIVTSCTEGVGDDCQVGTNYIAPCEPNCGGTGGSGGDDGGNNPPTCEAGEECAHKVQIGWVKLTHQYDGLFAGGSEIRWKSVDAIKSFPNDDSPTLAKVTISQHFSRGEINDGDWDEPNTQFDQNWEEYELAKGFKIYEADGNGLESLELAISVDAGPVTIEPTVSFDLSDDRANIFKTTYQRDVFFAENDQDLGNGLKEGVQIRHAGGVHWTMPITEISLD